MNERIQELIVKSNGYWEHGDHNMPSTVCFQEEDLKKFAELIAAKEREACAKAVEGYCGAWDDQGYALTQIIRARGQEEEKNT